MVLAMFVGGPAEILLLLVGGAVLVAGLVGLVLLVVGLVKRRPALWVSGIVILAVGALMMALAGVAAAVAFSHRAGGPSSVLRPPAAEEAGGPGGSYVRISGDRGMARAEGVDFEVLEPGGGGSRFLGRSGSGGGRSESRCEIALGDVLIVVTTVDGRTRFSVNGADYGSVGQGDSVVIDREREVRVNGQRREPVRE